MRPGYYCFSEEREDGRWGRGRANCKTDLTVVVLRALMRLFEELKGVSKSGSWVFVLHNIAVEASVYSLSKKNTQKKKQGHWDTGPDFFGTDFADSYAAAKCLSGHVRNGQDYSRCYLR